jgi:hypothetical protein
MTEECACCSCQGYVILTAFITYFLAGVYYGVIYLISIEKLEENVKILKRKVDNLSDIIDRRTTIVRRNSVTRNSTTPPPRYEEIIEG